MQVARSKYIKKYEEIIKKYTLCAVDSQLKTFQIRNVRDIQPSHFSHDLLQTLVEGKFQALEFQKKNLNLYLVLRILFGIRKSIKYEIDKSVSYCDNFYVIIIIITDNFYGSKKRQWHPWG